PGEDAARAALANVSLGHVSSRSESGAARMILATLDPAHPALDVAPEVAARIHLERHAEALGLPVSVAKTALVAAEHSLMNGASIVQLEQRVAGVQVFRARASILMDAKKQLVSLASSLHPNASAKKAPAFARGGEHALAGAYTAQFQRDLAAGSVRDTGARGEESRVYTVYTSQG